MRQDELREGLELLASEIVAYINRPFHSNDHLSTIEGRMASLLVARKAYAAVDVAAAVKREPRKFLREHGKAHSKLRRARVKPMTA